MSAAKRFISKLVCRYERGATQMTRERDQGQAGQDAVFRSSRRVSFVVRSETASRRFSTSRVSRDPMESMHVDVRPDPAPTPPAFGLDSDWQVLADDLADIAAGHETLRLWSRDAGDAFTASVALRDGAYYIAASGSEANSDSDLIEIERELFEMLKDHRKAVVVEIGSDKPNRLVSYGSVSELFENAETESDEPTPPSGPDQEAQAQPGPDPQPEGPISKPPDNSNAPPVSDPDDRTPTGTGDTSATDSDTGSSVTGAARLRALTAPRGFPDSLHTALVSRLEPFADAFKAAMLFQVEYVDGQTEYLVGFTKAERDQEAELEEAVNAALATAGRHDVELGITFLESDDPMVVRISRVGQHLA